MQLTQLSDTVTVSGQISADDIPTLAAMGVTTIVCNRPDGEEAGQPAFSTIASAAEAAQIRAVSLPFAAGQHTPAQAQALAELLGQGEKLHAYCRTGNRSSQLFKAATHG
jgi:sulfide:quinone oxidoreductase